MELLNKLNAFSSLEGSFKKMNELIINEKYPVTEIKEITTKYGNKLVVLLDDGSSLFLPQRCEKMTSDYLKLNGIKPLFFVYLGTKEVGKSLPAQMFQFEQ